MGRALLIAAAISSVLGVPNAAAEPAASALFGAVTAPSAGPAAAIGGYSQGCVAGAQALPAAGRGYQTMRPQRGRHFGHPALVAYVKRLAAQLDAAGHPGLLVGDMAQPRGGPMTSGHVSHQSGLDVDLWYLPSPQPAMDARTRATLPAVPLVESGTRALARGRFEAFATFATLRLAAQDPAVARIFVHPTIKQALCEWAGAERGWLRKVRPWWGHDHHFHVRLACPDGDAGCTAQPPPPAGDGCDASLAWWFTDEPWAPAPSAPREPLALAALPARCAALVGVN